MKTQLSSLLFLLIGFGLHAQLPSDGLSHYYPFSGNADDVISGYDPILVGNIQGAADRFGIQNCAYSFDGEWTSVMLLQGGAGGYPVAADSSFSVSLWYRYGSADLSDREYLFSKGFSYDNDVSFALFLFDGNMPFIGLGNGNSSIIQNTASWQTDSLWHHLVGTFEPAGMKFYFDNELLLDMPNVTIEFQSSDVHFGENFEGYLDDIAFYNKALEVDEVDALFNMSSTCVVGIENLFRDSSIDVYPNPGFDLLNIDLKDTPAHSLSILGIDGKEVIQEAINSTLIQLDIQSLASGVYTILFYDNEHAVGRKRIVVE